MRRGNADGRQMMRLLAALALALGGGFAVSAEVPRDFDQKVAALRSEMMLDPARTFVDADTLRAMVPADASAQTRTHVNATADWFRAEALIRLNRPAEAMAIIRRGLDAMARNYPDPGLRGDLVLARGGVASMLGRVEDALRDNQQAFRLFVQ